MNQENEKELKKLLCHKEKIINIINTIKELQSNKTTVVQFLQFNPDNIPPNEVYYYVQLDKNDIEDNDSQIINSMLDLTLVHYQFNLKAINEKINNLILNEAIELQKEVKPDAITNKS